MSSLAPMDWQPGRAKLNFGAYITGAARIADLELAAEAGVVGGPAVIDVIASRPVTARMGVGLVGMAGAVDVGPGIHPPLDLHRLARVVSGQLIGEGDGLMQDRAPGIAPHSAKSALDCQAPRLL